MYYISMGPVADIRVVPHTRYPHTARETLRGKIR